MVGVAGRSRGCGTCRKRRIKCDERKPICNRCAKADYICSGYYRAAQFVDETPRLERNRLKYASHTPDPSTKSDSDGIEEVPRNPYQSASTDEMHACFLLSNFLTGAEYLKYWMPFCLQNPSPSTSRLSIRALAAVYFSQFHHDPRVLANGLTIYGKAMRKLNEDLQDSHTAKDLSVLIGALALQLLELIAFNSQAGWLHHAGGIGRLIELRGPESFQSRGERYVLELSRVTVILGCLIQNKHCFLEQKKWKKIPWSGDPASQTPLILLQHIFCDIPGLLHDTEKLLSQDMNPNEFLALHKELSWKILDRIASVLQLRAQWEARNPNCCCEMPPMDYASTRWSNTTKAPFSTMLHFLSLEQASEITLYNVILLTLFELGFEVIGSSFDFTGIARLYAYPITNAALLPPFEVKNVSQFATEIARTIEFHMLDSHKSAGAFFIMFPMRWAFIRFQTDSPESRWVEVKMREMAEISGFGIIRQFSGGFRAASIAHMAHIGGPSSYQ